MAIPFLGAIKNKMGKVNNIYYKGVFPINREPFINKINKKGGGLLINFFNN